MTKKELSIIKEEYQANYNYYKLSNYKYGSEEHTRISAIKTFLQNMGINPIPFENEVILEKSTLISDWQEFCSWARKEELSCNDDIIDFIKDEISSTTKTEKQYNARIERIKEFKNRLYKLEIKLPTNY